MNEKIEEMKTLLNNYFDNTPMELSFKYENGDTDIINDEKALGVIDAITRQALIPVFCEALYNAGYRKQEWVSVDERLPDFCGMPVLMVAVNQYSQTRVVKGFTDYQCPITFHTNEKEYEGVWGAWDVTHWMPLPIPPKEKQIVGNGKVQRETDTEG